MAIVSTQRGRQAFISNRGIHFLCEINVKQTFQCEDALKLLLNILTIEGGLGCLDHHHGCCHLHYQKRHHHCPFLQYHNFHFRYCLNNQHCQNWRNPSSNYHHHQIIKMWTFHMQVTNAGPTIRDLKILIIYSWSSVENFQFYRY